jgi:CheY-like chemotaxis protein
VNMAAILLVEDEFLLAECYTLWLTATGHTVRHVTDAYAAVDAIDVTLPNVILLDLLLPGANGIQLLHTLRSHADLQHIPVIVCSNALPPNAPDLTQYGVTNVIDKTTIDRTTLCNAITKALI